MFGDEGSQRRYEVRRARFEADDAPFGRARHFGWWIIHNAVAHPLLALFPFAPAFRFHDWTSDRLNHW